ncbi:MAG: hypothetical protein ACM3MG_13795 [Bacillota bacterium]
MFRSLIVGFLFLGLSSSSFAIDKKYFEIKKVTIQEVTEEQPNGLLAQAYGVASDCSNLPASPNSFVLNGDLSPAAIDTSGVDQIINIGKAIWKIVEDGKPAVTKNINTASALPRGVSCWTDLSGWSRPFYKTFLVQYENAYGMKVVDFRYRLIYMAGGNVDGVGKYITNATFVISKLNVSWGYTFNATVEVPSVFNLGTKANPLAGMQMNMHWTVDTTVHHEEVTQSYFISGDGSLVQMN